MSAEILTNIVESNGLQSRLFVGRLMLTQFVRAVSVILLGIAHDGHLNASERGAVRVSVETDALAPRNSYALIIGIDEYRAGWPVLENAVADAEAVADALEAIGFKVTLGRNPTSDELKSMLDALVYEQGADANAEILIWFAGHGHTINGEGYIVPADAPLPGQTDTAFRRKAVSLRSFGGLMREIRATHVLSVFDSCFSGTIFTLDRAEPPVVELAKMLPVRQFISSGESSQVVSDDGTFRRLFVDALQGRAPSADANGDGYLTGSELGLFIKDKLTDLTDKKQTPRYGKLNAMGFDGGDFVFALPNAPEVSGAPAVPLGRRTITDRNGAVLAGNVDLASLVVFPDQVRDRDGVADFVSTLVPNADLEEVYAKLTRSDPIIFARSITSDQQERVAAAQIPGVRVVIETTRIYPGGPAAAPTVGTLDTDSRGEAGLERYLDEVARIAGLDAPLGLPALRSSIDLRIQNFVSAELEDALTRYKARQAGAVVLDVRTGEVLALASTGVAGEGPDFASNIVSFRFEPGSLSKAFTTALALESGEFTLDSSFDASEPTTLFGFTVRDFHGKGRSLTLPEAFIYSSNIAAGLMVQGMGHQRFREYLSSLDLFNPMALENGWVSRPQQPALWKPVHALTAGFGHGYATSPLNLAVAAAALVNGGWLIQPTLIARTPEEARDSAEQVLSAETSAAMRYLFRLTVEAGAGKNAEVRKSSRAAVAGFRVGGRSGTAEKVVNGRYTSDKLTNSFVGVLPIDDPRYAVVVVIDEPLPEVEGASATAGANTAPLVGKICERVGFLLALSEREKESR